MDYDGTWRLWGFDVCPGCSLYEPHFVMWHTMAVDCACKLPDEGLCQAFQVCSNRPPSSLKGSAIRSYVNLGGGMQYVWRYVHLASPF